MRLILCTTAHFTHYSVVTSAGVAGLNSPAVGFSFFSSADAATPNFLLLFMPFPMAPTVVLLNPYFDPFVGGLDFGCENRQSARYKSADLPIRLIAGRTHAACTARHNDTSLLACYRRADRP